MTKVHCVALVVLACCYFFACRAVPTESELDHPSSLPIEYYKLNLIQGSLSQPRNIVSSHNEESMLIPVLFEKKVSFSDEVVSIEYDLDPSLEDASAQKEQKCCSKERACWCACAGITGGTVFMSGVFIVLILLGVFK